MKTMWTKNSQKKKTQEICGDFYQTGGGHPCLLSLSKEIPMFERGGRNERERMQKL